MSIKTIETTAMIGPDRTILVQLPTDIAIGKHRVVVVIDEEPLDESSRPMLHFSRYPIGLASDTVTFRREDLYGDGI
jgi:hypothetical protein